MDSDSRRDRKQMGIEIRDCGTDRKKIRLAALDMDGTFLRSDKTLHPDTAGDLASAKASGIEPVLCTGLRAPAWSEERR